MALLPTSTLALTDTGGAVGTGSDLIIVAGPVTQGTTYSPQFFTSIAALLTVFGYGKAQEFCAHYVELAKKPFVFVGMTPVAGSVGPANNTGVLGSALPSIAGTPIDDENISVRITTATPVGGLGTAGMEFQYSRDGGQVWSSIIRIGTALTYVIPNSGLTITFGIATATLLLGDIFTVAVVGPTYDSTGLTNLRTALAASGNLSRLVFLVGTLNTTGATAQNASDLGDNYLLVNNRDERVVAELRAQYAPARNATGSTSTFATPAQTITRSAGSFITDGFQVGMRVSVTGAVNGANNIVSLPITAVTATILTIPTATFTAEVATANVVITAVEAEADWLTSLDAITINQLWPRLVLGGGTAMRTSPIDAFRKKRNASWPMAIRYMGHDVQVSPADGTLGRLEGGWTIYNADGTLACHDERSLGGLLHSRITCLRSFDTDPGGTYVALALTLAQDNRPLSRLPIACVGDMTSTICRAETTRLLNSRVILDPKTGYLTIAEKRRIEGAVQSILNNALITAKTEGQRASAVAFNLVNTTDLRQPGATVAWTCDLTGLGYLEQLSGLVKVQGAQ